MSDIRARLLQAIEAKTSSQRRYKELEGWTGISADRWRNVYTGKQRASEDMIEACARLWPQWAFWIVTGITDSYYGHCAPESGFDGVLNVKVGQRHNAEQYLMKKMEIFSAMESTERKELTDEESEELFSLTTMRKTEDELPRFDPRMIVRGRMIGDDSERIKVKNEHQKN